MLTTVEVTKRDTQSKERMSDTKCMGALALKKVIKHPYYVRVGVSTASIMNSAHKEVHMLHLPTEMANAIYDFVGGNKVEPFSVEVDIPHQFLRED